MSALAGGLFTWEAYNGVLLNLIKKETFSLAITEMTLEDIVLSQISQTQNDKYMMPLK